MIRTIDYSALASTVTKQDVAAYRAELAKVKPNYGSGSWVALIIVGVVGVMMASILITTLGTISASLARNSTGGLSALIVLLLPVIVVGVVVAGAVLLVRYLSAKRFERFVRLDRFAKANGLIFSPADPNPQYPGAIFGLGRARSAYEHFRSASGRFLDFGNYKYTTGSGKNSTTHTWGFMALELDRALPHMVLDSLANNFIGTNLPATFTKDQVLSLEGDFNRYFTLYCPKQYERDALYVFTPDLMALCIDNAAPFDIEIVDKWLFVYSAAPFDMSTGSIYQRLFGIVDTIGAKTLSQTDRYSDERVANFTANYVAPQGARLKRGVPVAAIVIGAVVLGFWLIPQIAGFILATGR
jgi:hypothetical protein